MMSRSPARKNGSAYDARSRRRYVMKGIVRTLLVALAVFLFAPAAVAADAKAAAPKAKPAAKPATLVTMTPDELKWVATPASPDDMMAVVRGDAAKGPHTAFHKFKAGFSAPLHRHSADITILVVSGTLIAGAEGGPEKKLPAGSYEYQPHTVAHVTKCDAGSECVIFVVASAKFDILPVEAKK
jgi:quercetin dioxygenase-like cupin family protein